MIIRITLVLFLIGFSCSVKSQSFVDSCFTSVNYGTSFYGSSSIGNSTDADMLQWTGTQWLGQWPNANIALPPPCNGPNQKAIWVGDDSSWTTGGEGFALLLAQPLVSGNSYTINFTYVSDGFGANGAFAPEFLTNSSSSYFSAYLVGNLTPVGYSWATNPFTFAATPSQGGDTWIIIHSKRGSGMVLSFCCSISTLPTANFTSSRQSLCSGDCISYTDQSMNAPQSWQWFFPGGNPSSSTVQNPPTVCYNTAGAYDATLIATNASGSDTLRSTNFITVNKGVTLTTIPAIDTAICPGSPVQLVASGATTYAWSPTTNLSCSACANPLLTTNNAGVYTVIATNSSGCSATKQININMGGSTVAGTISAVRDTICQGNRGSLTLGGNSSHLIQWQSSATKGNFADINGIKDTVNYETDPLSHTTYYRVVVGNGVCVDTSQYLQLFVPPALTAYFNFTRSGKTVTFNSDSSVGNIVSYSWTFGDGGSDNSQNPDHTYPKSDTTYNVCLTIYDGSNCSYTFCKDVDLTLGINNLTAQTNWNIYPDPFSNQLFIGGKKLNNKIKSVEIDDVLGRKVVSKTVEPTYNSPMVIDVSNLAQGMYFLRIKASDGDYVQKVIKE